MDAFRLETNTRALGRMLFERMQRRHAGLLEWAEDRSLVALAGDPAALKRLLLLVDALSGLPAELHDQRASRLIREYLGDPPSGIHRSARWLFATAAQVPLPGPARAGVADRIMQVMARRFIVSPSAETLNAVLAELSERSSFASIDLLGEAVLSDYEAKQYNAHYVDLLHQLASHPLAGKRTAAGTLCLEVSLKLTSLDPHFNPSDPKGSLRRLLPSLEAVFDTASAAGVGVTIDSEQFVTRELTWSAIQAALSSTGAFASWPDCGLVIQAYLLDAEQHAEAVIRFAQRRGTPIKVRLVKGAYWDQEVIEAAAQGWAAPVHRDKAQTDLAYERLVTRLMPQDTGIRLAVGTHNLRDHAYAEAVCGQLQLATGVIEHQTLHQTHPALSWALANVGWTAREYVPAGSLLPGMAYLVRRLLENTSQLGFLTRSRRHEHIDTLLAPPKPGIMSTVYDRTPHANGFLNYPASQLHRAGERERFASALAAAKKDFGKILGWDPERSHSERSPVTALVSPSDPTGTPATLIRFARPEDATSAIELANEGFVAWSARSPAQRAAIGREAAELLGERRFDVAAWVVHEGGRNWPEALADVEEGIDHLSWAAAEAARNSERWMASLEPRGVVGCIPPWNFPIALPAGMVSAALMTGNTVILKSAGLTPRTSQLLVAAFHDAGVPRNVLVHLPGPGSTVGEALVLSPDIDMIAFTGSKEVGLHIVELAAQVSPRRGGMKRVISEMGGKNAIIVFADANMDEAIEAALHSAFSHAGQKCSACSRVLVERSLLPEFRARLIEACRSLPLGPADDPGTVVNPVISRSAKQRILEYAALARTEGTVLLDRTGEGRMSDLLVGPMLVEIASDQAATARIAQEEIFGPILLIIPFGTEAEAADVANGVPYGLTVGIFTRSMATMRHMIQRCQVGNIYVNRAITGARVGIEPFGGHKLSGTGPKTGSEDYLPAFMRRRTDSQHVRMTAPLKTANSHPVRLPQVRAWTAATPIQRAAILNRTLGLPKHSPAGAQALPGRWTTPSGGPMAGPSGDTVMRALRLVVEQAGEIASSQPTVQVPGQYSFLDWSTPRGTGLVMATADVEAGFALGSTVAALIAGNGVLLVADHVTYAPVEAFIRLLHAAGVPESSCAIADPETDPSSAAGAPFEFMVAGAEHQTLGTAFLAAGTTVNHQMKAVFTPFDCLLPGESGSVRQFCRPRAVAIRTVHHGADLVALPGLE